MQATSNAASRDASTFRMAPLFLSGPLGRAIPGPSTGPGTSEPLVVSPSNYELNVLNLVLKRMEARVSTSPFTSSRWRRLAGALPVFAALTSPLSAQQLADQAAAGQVPP